METIDDDRLNETDQKILRALQEGRETTGSLADRIDRHPQTIRERLQWLREWDYVQYYHEPTALHKFTDNSGAVDDT